MQATATSAIAVVQHRRPSLCSHAAALVCGLEEALVDMCVSVRWCVEEPANDRESAMSEANRVGVLEGR